MKYLFLFTLILLSLTNSFGQIEKSKAVKRDKVAPCYQSKDNIVKADCFYNLGLQFNEYEQYNFAIENLNTALEYYPKTYFLERAKTHDALAFAYKNINDLNQAEANFQKAAELYKNANDLKKSTNSLEDVAEIQISRNDTQSAQNTLKKVLNNTLYGLVIPGGFSNPP